MSEFKVGDLVECVDPGLWMCLKKGGQYKIERICENYLDIRDKKGVLHDGLARCRFKLVKQNLKVGDLVECVSDSLSALTIGKCYKVISHSIGQICVNNDNGEPCFYNKERFEPSKPNLKVGDKVKSKLSERGIFTVYQIVDQVVFLNVGCSIEPFKLSDIEKVVEKTAPPKFTTVYVWDGPERPQFPRMQYSYGEMNDGKLLVFSADLYADASICYDNWEVIE